MHWRAYCALSLVILAHLAIAKPRNEKEIRMVELVKRNLLDHYENSVNMLQSGARGSKDKFKNRLIKRKIKSAFEVAPLQVETKVKHELLGIFGLQEPEINSDNQTPNHAKKPPKYMVDLYNAIADQNGISRTPNLLDADTVRSIPNIDQRCPQHCIFDIKSMEAKEIILDAELHIYQDKPVFNTNKSQKDTSYTVRIYQVVPEGNSDKILIAARRIPANLYGWQIFPLLITVEKWNSERQNNFGITIERTTSKGSHVIERKQVGGKEPILVLFTNDKRTPTVNYSKIKKMQNDHSIVMTNLRETNGQMTARFDSHANNRHKRDAKEAEEKKSQKNLKEKKQRKSRKKFQKNGKSKESKSISNQEKQKQKANQPEKPEVSGWSNYKDENDEITDQEFWEYGNEDYVTDSKSKADPYYSQTSHYASDSAEKFPAFSTLSNEASLTQSCSRYPLYVDFEDMGWSGWIIHPQGYNAYHCRGQCAFPLSENLKPSNHATVQSIMHTLGLGGQPVDMPCCTPEKLYDINLLYFDSNDYVVLRRYKDMVAASCACR